jgi:putative restriction endonuclease
MPRGEDWNKDETLLALRLYFPTPYGRIHGRNQEIIALAELLDRTVGSVARKMQNLASFDPVITESGRKGLTKASKLDAELFHSQAHGSITLGK